MLERLIHEPLAREIGQPLLTLSSLNKIDFDLILYFVCPFCFVRLYVVLIEVFSLNYMYTFVFGLSEGLVQRRLSLNTE